MRRAVGWEPLEISAVAIGADPGARVRSDDGPTCTLDACTPTRTINPATDDASIRAAAVIYSNASKVVDAFDRGALTRTKNAFWLAIPNDSRNSGSMCSTGRPTPG